MSKKISLTTAIFLCLNTMVGAGAFVNLKQLSTIVEKWGFVSYIVGAIITLPLILCTGELGRRLPVSGGLYVYSKTYLNKYLGFLSGWGYVVGKTTSATLLCHFLMKYIQSTVPFFSNIPIIALDYAMIILVLITSYLGALSKKSVQVIISAMKIVPFCFAFIVGASTFNMSNFIGNSTEFSSFLISIPSALYAFVGFEVICSVGGLIENPNKNIKRSILTAFFLVVVFNSLLQLLVYGALGPSIKIYNQPLAHVMEQLNPSLIWIGAFINGIFMASVFGSIVAMIASNSCNIAALAEDGHFPMKKTLTTVNKHHIPTASLMLIGVIACLILTITNQFVPLQNMAVFALFISSMLTAFSTLQATKNEPGYLYTFLAYISIFLCLGVLGICFLNIYKFGISLSFLSVFLSGCIITCYINRKSFFN